MLEIWSFHLMNEFGGLIIYVKTDAKSQQWSNSTSALHYLKIY